VDRDVYYMSLALEEAARARGRTRPNPMVGAVVVKEGEILARGYHHRAGLPHAEVEALSQIGEAARGTTMYVNLEPCSHYGRTPPCADRLIEAGVARVVVGVTDPNPRVNGRGIERLRAAGIQVDVGVLESVCADLNAPFFTYIRAGRPYVQLKIAMSLDARIATRTGDSRWLSGEEARRWAHQLRDHADAILVGVGTVIADDPALTVRWVEGRDPLRVVLDSTLRLPLSAQIVVGEQAAGTVVFCCRPDVEKQTELEARGVRVEVVEADGAGQVSLEAVLRRLHGMECLHLLVEGGGGVHGAFLRSRLVDRLSLVLTPWLLGFDGIEAFRFAGTDLLKDALKLRGLRTQRLGEDILLEAEMPKMERESVGSGESR
jgi:diaminohydroxyphosphoribosylaminopyrimidine deaminase/5-amino-6-(5-phosphoribosylamino)uracil reductase